MSLGPLVDQSLPSLHSHHIFIVRMVVEDNDEEIDVTEVSGDFFLAPESDKVREARSVSGPNLQAVTEALFDNCEDYQNIQNKSSALWRPY